MVMSVAVHCAWNQGTCDRYFGRCRCGLPEVRLLDRLALDIVSPHGEKIPGALRVIVVEDAQKLECFQGAGLCDAHVRSSVKSAVQRTPTMIPEPR